VSRPISDQVRPSNEIDAAIVAPLRDSFTHRGATPAQNDSREVDGRIRSHRVIEVLSRLISERGAPLYLRSDNGPEFVSRALLTWITSMGIDTALIDPGKPWQNGNGESFNGKFRDECLSLEWFRSRAEAKVVIEGTPQKQLAYFEKLPSLAPAVIPGSLNSAATPAPIRRQRARHDRERVHVRLAQAAARPGLDRPARADELAPARGRSLRDQRARRRADVPSTDRPRWAPSAPARHAAD